MDPNDFPTPEGEYLSASQIEIFRLCKRKWAWKYIDKIEGEPNIQAEKGIVVHKVLEEWLGGGVYVDLDETVELSDGSLFKPGPIAAAGLKHLPSPGSCGTERRITVKTPIAKYQGYIDFDQKGNVAVPVVGDHKTTGDFQWMKTAEHLKRDTQATIYAAALMSETGSDEVDLLWVYYRTRGRPKAKPVTYRISRQEVEKNFDYIDETAAKILKARREIETASQLEPNVSACDAYGGCPFRSNCNLSTVERMKALMSQESLRERMAARRTQKKDNEEKQQSTESAASSGGSLKERMKARKSNGLSSRTKGINPPPSTASSTPSTVSSSSKKLPEQEGGYILFVDCRPLRGFSCINVREVMEPAHQAVREKHNVSDYRLVEFGRGPGFLVAYLDQLLETLTGVNVYIDTSTPEGRDTINVFEKHAQGIIRAMG